MPQAHGAAATSLQLRSTRIRIAPPGVRSRLAGIQSEPVNLAAIRAARRRIAGGVVVTPQRKLDVIEPAGTRGFGLPITISCSTFA